MYSNVEMYQQEKCKQTQPERKRGRPAGKNRVPLSKEERRARNAQYERERRNETAAAMMQLAEAVGCPTNESNEQILRLAVQTIGQQTSEDKAQTSKLDDMRRINECLTKQIAKLQNDLSKMQGSRLDNNMGRAHKRKMEEKHSFCLNQIQRCHKNKKIKREADLSTSHYIQPEECCQPTTYTSDVDPLDVAACLPYEPSPEEASLYQSEFSWAFSHNEVPMEQQGSESEAECSSPVDIDDILESLSDEEKTLIWGVVQQIVP